MNRKDVWLLGLFALAYLYLDTAPAEAAASEPEDAGPPAVQRAPGTALTRVAPRSACPRNLFHTVNLRADGAMWCHACDEAFYPQVAIWNELMGAATA